MNGIIIIDKPQNYTSFDIIAILRKKFNQKKIGHMGTLDPMATGVLPVLLGDTAKFQIFTENKDKEYIAKMEFGLTTDTLDSTGNILSTSSQKVTEKSFLKAIENFLGKIKQIPPMFSAIKQNGKKLCDLARKGIEVERKEREVVIKNIDVISFDEKTQTAVVKVKCSAGTYIRTLCSDIGNILGCGAIMTELRRTESNGFKETESITLDEIEKYSTEEIRNNYVFPTEYLFKNFKKISISEAQKIRFKNGGALSIERIFMNFLVKDEEILQVYCKNEFVGLGLVCKEKNEIKVLKHIK